MDHDKLPKLESAKYTRMLSIPVEPAVKDELDRMKREEKVKVTEWLRQLIQRELAMLKASS
jgi:hypothetical protein